MMTYRQKKNNLKELNLEIHIANKTRKAMDFQNQETRTTYDTKYPKSKINQIPQIKYFYARKETEREKAHLTLSSSM